MIYRYNAVVGRKDDGYEVIFPTIDNTRVFCHNLKDVIHAGEKALRSHIISAIMKGVDFPLSLSKQELRQKYGENTVIKQYRISV